MLQTCDAIDGLVDGQITNPRACVFDIDSMGPAGDGTLTAAELKVAKAMYAGTTSETGQQRYTGANFGSEADWDPNFADNGGYGPFIGHYVYSMLSPPFDWRRDINFSTVYDQAKIALTPITAAPSPDITAFVNRGGKLAHYHGMNDSVVPPDGSIAYLHALTQFEKLRHVPKAVFDQQSRSSRHRSSLRRSRPSSTRSRSITACSCCLLSAIAEAARVPARSAAERPSRRPRSAMPSTTW